MILAGISVKIGEDLESLGTKVSGIRFHFHCKGKMVFSNMSKTCIEESSEESEIYQSPWIEGIYFSTNSSEDFYLESFWVYQIIMSCGKYVERVQTAIKDRRGTFKNNTGLGEARGNIVNITLNATSSFTGVKISTGEVITCIQWQINGKASPSCGEGNNSIYYPFPPNSVIVGLGLRSTEYEGRVVISGIQIFIRCRDGTGTCIPGDK